MAPIQPERSLDRIYLDYNASTPIDPEVWKEMEPCFVDYFGNPSSAHWASEGLHDSIESARSKVAALLRCAADEIVFTSGGSEANNQAIKGIFFALRIRGNHIVTTKIEHPSVTEPIAFLEKLGADVTYVDVDEYGFVSPEAIEKAITDKTILITVMHANNEVGTLQPIAEIARIAREYGVYLHTDAAQSIGKVPVDAEELGVDMLSIAGHKIYAPKGVGALYIRKGTAIEPFVHGAGHESGRRAGTENVPYLVGLGKAAELVHVRKASGYNGELGKRFWRELKDHFHSRVSLNGHPDDRLPNTFNINFHGFSGQEVLRLLPEIAASTGSACHTGITALSPVLKAMKVKEEFGKGAVRFSLGRYTTENEIMTAIRLIFRCACTCRKNRS
ncbi:cysteine desulfurase family protein [Cohnella suwonensis]|uniref:cysteine desulfurase n=1 Tax=Cohnella suwonensis TaxID=696072 RepID=A0ABW0LZE1_9BACL